MSKMQHKLAVWVLLASAVISSAALAGIDEGIEYMVITPPVLTNTANKIEVIEAFSYACPHCFQFEPVLSAWKKQLPANVELVRFPVIFPKWPESEVVARAFYTAEALGILEKIHVPLFEALHNQKRDLYSDNKMAAFFVEHGVNKKVFLDTFRSFSVDSKMRRAQELTNSYQVEGVPTMIVNGKYRTSSKYAATHEGTLKVVDHLIKKVADK